MTDSEKEKEKKKDLYIQQLKNKRITKIDKKMKEIYQSPINYVYKSLRRSRLCQYLKVSSGDCSFIQPYLL